MSFRAEQTGGIEPNDLSFTPLFHPDFKPNWNELLASWDYAEATYEDFMKMVTSDKKLRDEDTLDRFDPINVGRRISLLRSGNTIRTSEQAKHVQLQIEVGSMATRSGLETSSTS